MISQHRNGVGPKLVGTTSILHSHQKSGKFHLVGPTVNWDKKSLVHYATVSQKKESESKTYLILSKGSNTPY